MKPKREHPAPGSGRSPRPSIPADHDADQPLGDLLVAQAQSGDQQALETLLNRHADMLYATCFRMVGNAEDARDLAQDVLVKVIESLGSFDGRAKFTTWLTRIAINHCLTHRRRQRLRKHASLDGPGISPENNDPIWATMEQDREPSGPVRVEYQEMQQVLRDAMQQIDADSRALLVLRDVRGLDYGQIGEVLDIPLGTVKSRLFRARASLRERMEAMWQTDSPVNDSE